VDFVQRDARNRELGRNGEEWALELERRRLHDVDKRPDLSKRLEWVAGGDGSASAPRMYPLTGALDQVCRLEPQSFVARVG